MVNGANPRTVTVNTGGTAQTTFSFTCSGQIGDPQVNTATTGEDLDPDGYTVTADGSDSQSIGTNDQVTFSDLAAGDHQVELTASPATARSLAPIQGRSTSRPVAPPCTGPDFLDNRTP